MPLNIEQQNQLTMNVKMLKSAQIIIIYYSLFTYYCLILASMGMYHQEALSISGKGCPIRVSAFPNTDR